MLIAILFFKNLFSYNQKIIQSCQFNHINLIPVKNMIKLFIEAVK